MKEDRSRYIRLVAYLLSANLAFLLIILSCITSYLLFFNNSSSQESSIEANVVLNGKYINPTFSVLNELYSIQPYCDAAFGESEYECTGTCYCSNERRAAIVGSRKLVLIVMSLSSLLALRQAKLYFSEKCSQTLECEGGMTRVHSEVDHCIQSNKYDNDKYVEAEFEDVIEEEEDSSEDSAKEKENVKVEEEEKVEEKVEEKEEETYPRAFECTGGCLPYDFTKTDHIRNAELIGNCRIVEVREDIKKCASEYEGIKGPCSEKILNKEIEVNIPVEPKSFLSSHEFESMEEAVTTLFITNHLDPFCIDSSKYLFEGYFGDKELNWCCGRNIDFDGMKGLHPEWNPSAKCVFKKSFITKQTSKLKKWLFG